MHFQGLAGKIKLVPQKGMLTLVLARIIVGSKSPKNTLYTKHVCQTIVISVEIDLIYLI